jgi:hypothetical protein
LGFAAPFVLKDCPEISGRESEILEQVNQASDHWKQSFEHQI